MSDMSSPCGECGIPTTPTVANQPTGPWDWYVLHDDVWEQATPDGARFLHVACAEVRLGRVLHAGDFADYPINFKRFRRERAPRLLAALARRDPRMGYGGLGFVRPADTTVRRMAGVTA